MTRTGIVKSVEEAGITVVLSDASCEGCTTPCSACRREQRPQTATVENTLGASVGDRVQLFCPGGVIVFYSLLFFLVPIALGIGVCLWLNTRLSQGHAALFAALSAAGAFLGAGFVLSRPKIKRKNAFVLARILARSEDEKELDKL